MIARSRWRRPRRARLAGATGSASSRHHAICVIHATLEAGPGSRVILANHPDHVMTAHPADPQAGLVRDLISLPLTHGPGPSPASVPTAPATPEVETAPKAAPTHVSEEVRLVEAFAEPGAEEGAGAAVHMVEPWKGYGQTRGNRPAGPGEPGGARRSGAVRGRSSRAPDSPRRGAAPAATGNEPPNPYDPPEVRILLNHTARSRQPS